MKISVCTDMLFNGRPMPAAMEKAKEAGADAVEFWETTGKDLPAIAAASRSLGLPVAVFCAPAVSMIAPDSPAKYAEALKGIVPACDTLGCRTLIACSGVPEWGWTPAEMHDRLRATCEAALPALETHELTLLLEPLNVSELSYLRSSREAFDLCRMFNSPRIKVLYDIYHMQLMEGNLINTIRANLPLIGHFHAADLPNRTAPGSGEINFPNLARALLAAGYNNYFGLEYQPITDAVGELTRVIKEYRSYGRCIG